MNEFDLLFRFWELRARYEELSMPLTDAERIELLSLVQLAGSEPHSSANADGEQHSAEIPVKLTAGHGFLSGELQEIAPEILVVSAAEHLEAGQRTILYLADAVTGVEYSLPCVVRWARDEEPALMGLSVDGIPTRAIFTLPPPGLWRSPLGLRRLSPTVQA